jgi:hypothetical protein
LHRSSGCTWQNREHRKEKLLREVKLRVPPGRGTPIEPSKEVWKVRRVISVVSLLVFAVPLLAGPSLVRINIGSRDDVYRLMERGIRDIPYVNYKKGFLEALVPQRLLPELKGYSYEIVVPDLSEEFESAALRIDFGPYYTYQEATDILDSLASAHPDLMTPLTSIGTTWEGRDIWAFKISDNPNVDEDEPTVLFTGVHHAREPIGCYILVELARYLLDHYSTDSVIQWLVDNREIWFIPIVNPDGYVYNQYSDGYWRKNKRDNNNNGQFEEGYDGVDLNRNYGYMWGYDDIGSSPYPGDQTYRGPSPFSEPEAQAVRTLCDNIQPVIAINYHSYSNMILFPWGYDYIYTPDDALFRAMANVMNQANGYTIGTPWELLYLVNGDSDDWMYGEQVEKPKIFAFTPEVGESFWQPDINTITEQFNENLPLNMYVIKAAGLFLEVTSYSFLDQNGSGTIDPGDTVYMRVTLRNMSPAESGTGVTGTVSGDPGDFTVIDGSASFGNIDPFPDGYANNNDDPFVFALSPDISPGTLVPLTLNVQANGGAFNVSFDLGVWVGLPEGFADDMESGEDGWTHEGSGDLWHLTTHRSSSPTHSWYCGNEGTWEYNNNMNASLVTPVITITPGSQLTFNTWYDLETGYDYGYIEISTDGGSTWQTLGTVNGYSGGWVQLQFDLSDYQGQAQIRFRLNSDTYVTAEGWYIDDVVISPPLPPDIDVSPLSISVFAPPDTTVIETLSISNVGEGVLNFSVWDIEEGQRKIEERDSKKIVQHVEFPKGAKEPVNPPQTAGFGGPDDYGYSWIDSDESGGPNFMWVEISGIGTPLNLYDDDYQSVNLPWTFDFYGSSKTSLLISSNGYLTFGSDGTDYSNDPIPDPTNPNDLIAVFWDDLNPSTGGQVYYYYDSSNDRFIVEWYQVPHYYNSGSYTFEVILYPNGDMLYQYYNMNGELTSATIGIENQDASIGLQVVYNASYIHNNLAVLITTNQGWLSVYPRSGSLMPGNEQAITVEFNTAGLSEGPYFGSIYIASNDPDEDTIVVPVSLVVGSYIPGDANGDGQINVLDLNFLASYLFAGGPPPDPILRGDENGDCLVNVNDIVYLAFYLYSGGPPPQVCSNEKVKVWSK